MNRILLHIVFIVCCFSLIQQMQARKHEPESNNWPVETLSLYSDRNLYVVGEKIIYSVHIRQSLEEDTSRLSKVAYVELSDHEMNPIIRQKLAIEKNTIEGLLNMPNDLRTGRYYLRAFTRYSRNFMPSASGINAIDIINPELPANIEPANQNPVSLFPEYGNIQAGIINKIAFRINNIHTEADRIILRENEKDISDSAALFYHNQYGDFRLNPDKSKKYSLVVYHSNGDSARISLSVENDEKPWLSYNAGENKIVFNRLQDAPAGTSFEIKSYSPEGTVTNSYQAVNFPLDISYEKLKAGINYFVINTGNEEEISKIAVYKDFQDPVKVDLILSKTSYKPREAIELNIAPLKEKVKLNHAVLSVVKKGTTGNQTGLPSFLMENIFLLKPEDVISAQVKRQVETACVIYNSRLSNGETDFNPAFTNDHELWLPDIRDISISGIIRDKKSGKALPGVSVVGSLLFDLPQIHISKTNDEGFFIFSFYELYGTREIFIGTLNKSEQQEIMINNEFAMDFPGISITYTPPDSNMTGLLDQLYLNTQIKNIYQKDKQAKIPEVPEIFGNDVRYTYPDEFISLASLQDVFNEIVPYARMRINKEEVSFGTYNTKTGIWNDNPLVLLDNVPVSDLNTLKEIHPAEIEKIGIITNTFVTGDHFLPGIILIFTKSGKFGGVEFPENAVFLEYQMYSITGKPVFPDFSDPANKDLTLPYFYNTLYWNPSVETESGKTISFYTSDHLSEYEIILKGVTEDGHPVYGQAHFEVQK